MNMKTTQLITAALIFSASVSAFAQQTTDTATNAYPTAVKQESKEIVRGKTRAEVIAELQDAEAAGKAMPTGFVAFDAPAAVTNAPAKTAIARK
jgi:hypothetical protein